MIELKAPMSIKNEYVLELYDKDGKLKDKAYAYNLVTDAFWKDAFTTTTGWSPFYAIRLGTGTGTPSVSDTALFRSLVEAATTLKRVQYAYPTSVATFTATFPASASAVGVITEVGFSKGTNSSYLQTHALLQDSEGNPITINKTDTDTLIVTAKVHCTVSASDNLNLVSAGSFIGFTRTFKNNSQSLAPYSCSLSASPCLPVSSQLHTTNYSAPGSYSTRSFTFPVQRINKDTGNGCYVNTVYVGDFGTVQLPNESIFPAYALQPMRVGTGDGTTTSFKCPIPDFVENTEVVTVDGVELIRDVDYTVDPIGNTALNASAIAAYSNFAESISASLSSTPPANYTWYLFGIRASSKGGLLIGKSDKPMTFDLGSEKTCNALFTDLVLAGNDYPSAATDCTLTLEYSNDNVSWQAATSVDTKFIGAYFSSLYPNEYKNTLTKFDPITARYWRIYSSGSSSYLSSKGLGCNGNSFFGYVGDGIVFKEPPADGAEIKIKATVNRPYKTSDYLIDYQISVYF